MIVPDVVEGALQVVILVRVWQHVRFFGHLVQLLLERRVKIILVLNLVLFLAYYVAHIFYCCRNKWALSRGVLWMRGRVDVASSSIFETKRRQRISASSSRMPSYRIRILQ